MEQNIDYESMEYGNYVLGDNDVPFNENVKYDKADYNKLYFRRVRLPDGKSNVIYLMSNNFNNSISMIKNQSFFIPPSYRRVYYPPISIGQFMKKRYRFNVTKLRKERDAIVKEAKKILYPARRLPSSYNENVFFITSDLYEAIDPIVLKLPIKRCYGEFLSEFIRIISSFTPTKPETDNPKEGNRILIIDADSFAFKQGAPLKDNKDNPLYLLYLNFLRSRDLSKSNIDIDILICSRNLFMKFNPKELTADKWNSFRRFLFRIMNANLDDYTDNLSEEEKEELEEDSKSKTMNNIINNAVSPYTKNIQPSTKIVLQHSVQTAVKKEEAKKAVLEMEMQRALGDTKPQKSSVTATSLPNTKYTNASDLFKKVFNKYDALASDTGMFVDDDEYEEWEDEVRDDTIEVMHDDETVATEVLDEIQDHTVPMKHSTSPVNSKRDEKLREEQKKVIVKNETIEQILERDSSNVPIEVEDKSAVMHTSNQNMKQIRWANFDKTYLDELYTKDIVECFNMLKDKDTPFYITNIDIKDTSTSLDYKDTWTVSLKDEVGKRHTVKVDIPKFQNNRFMLINGTRFIILKQNFYNPLVKDTPDTVILTTNFNKVTITRKSTRSFSAIEKIFSILKKGSDLFVAGDSSEVNMKYLSCLEFDEISRRVFSFKNDGCELFFSRKYLEEEVVPNVIVKVNDDEFVIGHEGDSAVIINEDTGLDRKGRTIINIIYEHLDEESKALFDSKKDTSQAMYVEAKMAGVFVPIISILCVWIGLSKTLDRMAIQWRFDNTIKRIPKDSSGKKYIRFANGILEYEPKIFAELIMNGLLRMHPEKFNFEDFDNETGYEEFIYTQWGSYNGINELITFYEFLIDPITEKVCKDMMLPSDAPGLLIHAVKLLSDNAYVSKASDKSYRVRSIEMIPSILYGCIAAQYKAHVKSGRRVPMTLNQRCVIQKLLAEKTVEPYSTLNPVVEVGKMNTISTKGYKGSNSEHSYDEEKRSYDPSAVGKIAITTSAKPFALAE